MKYLPTLNLWDAGIHSALVNGQLKLQVGQWIQCGEGPKSRFVSVNTKVKYIDAVHFTGTASNTRNKFIFRAAMARLNKWYDKGLITAKEFRDLAPTVSGTRNNLLIEWSK